MLQKLKVEDFPKVYKIMDASFPVDEHRPYKGQEELLKDPKYSIYVIPDEENDDIKAFITVWRFDDFGYIEHFAVNPIYRNGGIGSMVLQEAVKMLGYPVCLEVELPEDEISKRRIGFYERNGFVLNDYPYIQPALAKGQNPIPLRVMTSGSKVSEDRYEKMKTLLYRYVYKVIG